MVRTAYISFSAPPLMYYSWYTGDTHSRPESSTILIHRLVTKMTHTILIPFIFNVPKRYGEKVSSAIEEEKKQESFEFGNDRMDALWPNNEPIRPGPINHASDTRQ